MHYHLEIVLPPTDNIEKAVEQILAPFDENYIDEDGNENRHGFWDWYQLGGRWSGSKLINKLDKDKINAFYKLLNAEKITINGMRTGKATLNPENQAPLVDKMWRDFFPESPLKICPLFSHFDISNNNIKGDVITLSELDENFKAAHVIIASKEAEFMISDSIWNGVNFVTADWDGKVSSAIEKYKEKIELYKDEYKETRTPKPDWLVVTIDYHS